MEHLSNLLIETHDASSGSGTSGDSSDDDHSVRALAEKSSGEQGLTRGSGERSSESEHVRGRLGWQRGRRGKDTVWPMAYPLSTSIMVRDLQ